MRRFRHGFCQAAPTAISTHYLETALNGPAGKARGSHSPTGIDGSPQVASPLCRVPECDGKGPWILEAVGWASPIKRAPRPRPSSDPAATCDAPGLFIGFDVSSSRFARPPKGGQVRVGAASVPSGEAIRGRSTWARTGSPAPGLHARGNSIPWQHGDDPRDNPMPTGPGPCDRGSHDPAVRPAAGKSPRLLLLFAAAGDSVADGEP